MIPHCLDVALNRQRFPTCRSTLFIIKISMEINKYLESMLKEMEENAEGLTDDGHATLMADLMELIKKAASGRFHDFHKNGAPAPKMELVNELESLIAKVKDGEYD